MNLPIDRFFYELRDGEAWWITPDQPSGIGIGEYVSILYDEDYVLLKHGSYQHVSEYMKRMQEALQPLPMKLIHTRILISGQYDIEAINRIINTTGFLRELLTQGECL